MTVVTPAGYDEVYGYDAVNGGRLISFTPGNGDAPETFGYDAAGFLNQVQDSDGNLVTMTNDIHGNVLSRTWYPVEPASSGPAAGHRGRSVRRPRPPRAVAARHRRGVHDATTPITTTRPIRWTRATTS